MEKLVDVFTDVLIVGTGIAGLYAALNLREDINIIMITKTKIKESNSYLAQGGIAVAKGKEDIPAHIEDTMKAGKNLNKKEAVKVLVEESIENVDALIAYGVPFDKQDGGMQYTREGAHSTNRIVHSKDQTGKAVIDTLVEKALIKKNITIYEDTYLVDLIQKENTCYGGVAIREDHQANIYAKVVILACGGIGGIFKRSTNQRYMTADGINIAMNNNVEVKNLKYIQFHPTALYDKGDNRKFLISESLRGEGAKLLNINSEPFVDELLPRDVVTAAIKKEMIKTKAEFVYLNISFLDKDYIIKRFPKIYEECLKRGIDITKDYIPVTPTQHYFMGGIKVDLYARSSMKNLYAVGEVSCTGVHGANRLASNSLLEGLVFSKRAAKQISKRIDGIDIVYLKQALLELDLETIKNNAIKKAVKIFSKKVGIKDELVNY